MAMETTRGTRGGAGGSREVGCETDDPAGAEVELFAAGEGPALAAGINDAKFNVEDFLAILCALAR